MIPTATELEEFAVDFGLIFAGWVTNGPHSVTPPDREQLAMAAIAAVAAYARRYKDDDAYDPNRDITEYVQLAAFTYGEAVKSTMVAHLRDAEGAVGGDAVAAADDEGLAADLAEIEFLTHELERLAQADASAHSDEGTSAELPGTVGVPGTPAGADDAPRVDAPVH
jgi:hypothetical protein